MLELFEYLIWSNRSSCQLVANFGGRMKRNSSGLDGQKAVCLDPAVAPRPGNCLVYSFGINNEWSFEDAMAKYGCQVYSFDPSMKAKDHDRSPWIHFYNLGLGSRDGPIKSGPRWKIRWHFLTLQSVFKMLKPSHKQLTIIDYLKLNIDEWTILPDILATGMMDRVRQLAVEIHLSDDETVGQLEQRIQILRSVENYGMTRFDSKYDPWYMSVFKDLDGRNSSRRYTLAWYNENLAI